MAKPPGTHQTGLSVGRHHPKLQLKRHGILDHLMLCSNFAKDIDCQLTVTQNPFFKHLFNGTVLATEGVTTDSYLGITLDYSTDGKVALFI